MLRNIFLIVFICLVSIAMAQNNEFPKGWVINLEFSQGLTTQFSGKNDFYIGEIRLDPQYSLIEQKLRLGMVASVQYTNGMVFAAFGPHIAINIKSIIIPDLNSSAANVQWMIEHLWGTSSQRLIGTGIKLEIARLLLFSLMVHRDYNLNYWRLQTGIGFNLMPHHHPSKIIIH